MIDIIHDKILFTRISNIKIRIVGNNSPFVVRKEKNITVRKKFT